MRVLIIEDDHKMAHYLGDGLTREGHQIQAISTGPDGLEMALAQDFDVVVLDRMLPGLDGLSLLKRLRAAGRKMPVLLLTAMGGLDDRVEGLDAGADDYLVKPFAFSEAYARLNALVRRPPIAGNPTTLTAADLHMDLIARTVSRGGVSLDLGPKEFLLLEILLRNKNRVMTKTMLLERVWSFHFDPQTSLVETHISRLRAKIDRPFASALVETVRGAGYVIRAS
ncbi:two-component response regulator [Parvularcula bermudensis HTCC2503]|uniref:Two-component response regulator n=1 Tax=Parvularcula bermudensis (strain ATCC BAA-594 / HTCC2503 / KCTC 12087) TaxID=314260 RepID=E0TIK6_PARBH|nr:response regulator transcription factor [Parvularcula bermudensis]ADM10864.1 two-component response regulator [Parvularcula bermudensis HTCC2503]